MSDETAPFPLIKVDKDCALPAGAPTLPLAGPSAIFSCLVARIVKYIAVMEKEADSLSIASYRQCTSTYQP